jgi:hypothetical protein
MWEELVGQLDYHHRKWYECQDGDWQEVGVGRVFQVLSEIAPDADHADIVKRFKYRDRETTARKIEK